MQERQPEWAWQWEEFRDDTPWLFHDWIAPNTLEIFRGKDVLDCGCGGGQHLALLAPLCRSIVGIDLNTATIARSTTAHLPNVEVREGDITQMNLNQQFDIVYSVGVLHHTDDPDASFQNILRHCRPGGRVIVWVYSFEGNLLNRTVLEWLKRHLLSALPRWVLLLLAHALTLLLYLPIYTIYLLPPLDFARGKLRLGVVGLPFYKYFQNWRRLTYRRNLLNVFDKLNAPQTHFLSRAEIEQWFPDCDFTDVHVSQYKGVSWRGSGRKRCGG